jgi:hypothetical protein
MPPQRWLSGCHALVSRQPDRHAALIGPLALAMHCDDTPHGNLVNRFNETCLEVRESLSRAAGANAARRVRRNMHRHLPVATCLPDDVQAVG